MEAKEHRERLKVRHDFYLLRQRTVLTPPQRERRQRELESERGKEAREHREKLEVRCDPTSSGRHSNRMLLVLILVYSMPDLVGGSILNVAKVTQEGYYPNSLNHKSFRTSFHSTLRSRHSA